MEDPRVFFAAERTLLAWQRTGLMLIAFGFVVERAGLLLQVFGNVEPLQDLALFWLGLIFMSLGVITILTALFQFSKVLPAFTAAEIPATYRVGFSLGLNLLVAFAGLGLLVTLVLLRL